MREFDERASFSRPREHFSASNLEVAFCTCSLNNGFGIGARDSRTDEAVEEPRERES